VHLMRQLATEVADVNGAKAIASGPSRSPTGQEAQR
jgi:hypothetical protein